MSDHYAGRYAAAIEQRDAARADAERLAAALRNVDAAYDKRPSDLWAISAAWKAVRLALAAHDALTGDKQ